MGNSDSIEGSNAIIEITDCSKSKKDMVNTNNCQSPRFVTGCGCQNNFQPQCNHNFSAGFCSAQSPFGGRLNPLMQLNMPRTCPQHGPCGANFHQMNAFGGGCMPKLINNPFSVQGPQTPNLVNLSAALGGDNGCHSCQNKFITQDELNGSSSLPRCNTRVMGPCMVQRCQNS